MKFSFGEHLKLRETLTKHSEHLMSSHSNLLAVSASKLKSRNLGKQTELKTCIVLYVHVKGIIPVEEQLFPQEIGGFQVDVREAIVKLYMGNKLAMGSCIFSKLSGKPDLQGKLGGFVRFPNGKLGCLTCAHLFANCDSQREIYVYQNPSNFTQPFGKVVQKVVQPGDTNTIGLDAALIEITDILSTPDDGHFRIESSVGKHVLYN